MVLLANKVRAVGVVSLAVGLLVVLTASLCLWVAYRKIPALNRLVAPQQQPAGEESAAVQSDAPHPEDEAVNLPPPVQQNIGVIRLLTPESGDEPHTTKEGEKAGEAEESQSLPPAGAEASVLAIRIRCLTTRHIPLTLLHSTATDFGLQFGDQNIYHYAGLRGKEVEFSMANGFEPGTFDLSLLARGENEEQETTAGVALFMQLPGPSNPRIAADHMIRFADTLKSALEGAGIRVHFRDLDNQTPLLSNWREDIQKQADRFEPGGLNSFREEADRRKPGKSLRLSYASEQGAQS